MPATEVKNCSDDIKAVEIKQRLFFALWPDEITRLTLASLALQQARNNGCAVPASNLHLTLVFVGGVSAVQRACMELAAASVIAAPFSVTLDCLGYWPRPKALWAGVSHTPSALTDLVTRLSTALIPCGYESDPRSFKAHVTLVRKARHAPVMQQLPPLRWQAQDFCLVESVTGEQGVEYRVLERWPLRG